MQQSLEIIGRLFALSTVRYFVLAGIPFLIFYKLFTGRYYRAKIQERQADRADFVREIGHSLQTTVVFTGIGFLILFTPIRQYTRVYAHLTDYPGWWIPVSLFFSLVLHDTYFYWMHRLLHTRPLYRYTHLLHHKSVNPSPWASYSFHLLEAFTEGAVLLVIVMLIPVHSLTIALFVITGFVINVYGHLGYEIAPRWLRHSFLFEILNTSVHHNLHHSRFKGNFGLYFRVWDRLMNTENPDYVREYDRIQAKRFAPVNQPSLPLFSEQH